jgi:hypothetical protein
MVFISYFLCFAKSVTFCSSSARVACVEIIHPQLMTAEKDLNLQGYIKPVLTSL